MCQENCQNLSRQSKGVEIDLKAHPLKKNPHKNTQLVAASNYHWLSQKARLYLGNTWLALWRKNVSIKLFNNYDQLYTPHHMKHKLYFYGTRGYRSNLKRVRMSEFTLEYTYCIQQSNSLDIPRCTGFREVKWRWVCVCLWSRIIKAVV